MSKFFKFFKYIYISLATITGVLFFLGIAAAVIDRYQGRVEKSNETFIVSVIMLFVVITWIIWSKISDRLSATLSPQQAVTREDYLGLSSLFLMSFGVDVARRIFGALSPDLPNYNMKNVSWPSITDTLPEFLFRIYVAILRVGELIEGFFLITIYGLPSLVIGLVLAELGRKQIKPGNN